MMASAIRCKNLFLEAFRNDLTQEEFEKHSQDLILMERKYLSLKKETQDIQQK